MSDAVDQNIVVDFSGVEDMQFEALPRGKYQVRVIEAEVRQGPKAPYINVGLVVDEDDEENPYNGRRVWDIITLSAKALWKLKNFLKAAGMTDEELAEELTLDVENLIDTVVIAQVSIEKYNDEDRNRVKRYFAAGYEVADIEAEAAQMVAAD